jgi:hypothetical protein
MLPAGKYEMIASIVPSAPKPDGRPVITLDVAAEGGERVIAACKYRLGQFQYSDTHAAAELRLPFILAADLPAAARTIETRVFSSGDACFLIRSVAVRIRSGERRNWFPYLAVGECGIYTGSEIQSMANEVGCIAYTPPIEIDFGHYEVSLNIVDDGASDIEPNYEACITIEIYSGSEILAMQTWRRGPNDGSNLLTFDFTKKSSPENGIELFIRALTPAVVSLRGLRVERMSNENAMSRLPDVLSAKEWLPFFHVGEAGLRAKQGILAHAGKMGNIAYILFLVPPGWYEITLKVERVGADGYPGGQVIVTAGRDLLGSRRIKFTPRLLGPIRIPRGSLRICSFEVPVGLQRETRGIQIRVESTGPEAFAIRSIVVRPKPRFYKLRDRAYAAAAKSFRRVRSAVEFIKFVKLS